MRYINFIDSLMKFNERVLDRGSIDKDDKYTMSDLKNKLMFNKIFWNNINEIFQKYDFNDIIEDYKGSIKIYNENINNIIDKITEINPNIKFSYNDSFERRLEMEKVLENQLITKCFVSIKEIKYEFLMNIIYYISYLPDGYIVVTYIDPRSSIYTRPISFNINGNIIYWKIDDCIINYINRKYNVDNTISLKVTLSRKENIITKVECNSNKIENCFKIADIFPPTSLILYNNFIYIDDIDIIIDKQIPVTIQEKTSYNNIDLDSILKQDMLYEYPIHSFNIYLQFLIYATNHKNVESICITLYRIGDNPSLYYILRDAVKKGIKVYANIELMASGENINKFWVDEMRSAGIFVSTYAVGKLKVHSKITLIRFIGGEGILQIGTGNYHTHTTTQYTDLSLLTSNNDICKQAWKLFQLFFGNIEKVSFNKNFLVTRYNARKELIKLIEEETKLKSKGYIIIKANSFDDKEISKYLSKAAKAGCNIFLIIRGVCTWIPEELGKNVHIRSIVWNKLEHSRVLSFGINNPTIYIGSLDLVTNKLDERIETMVKITDPIVLRSICDYLNRYITNTNNAWRMLSNGEYIKE